MVSTRTRPYWPGRRILPGLENAATMRIVPVLESTCRSASRILPSCGWTLPSVRISASDLPKKLFVRFAEMASLFCTKTYSCSLIGKKALIGSTCETEVKTELGPTRLPIWTCAIPAIPSTNEMTFVHSRLSSACSTARTRRYGMLKQMRLHRGC